MGDLAVKSEASRKVVDVETLKPSFNSGRLGFWRMRCYTSAQFCAVSMQGPASNHVRFGGFELDLKSGELRVLGVVGDDNKILLREQAFQVLRMLIESGGKLVTRDEIRKRLWPNDTIVDFDHSINAAIKTLRRALGDSADNPQYIETVARRGYRLRVVIEWLETNIKAPAPENTNSMSLPGVADLVGKRVSHYRILEVIGSGGMGMVYKAEDLKLSRWVALKFLPGELVADPAALKRFEREAQAASALNHPNICTIHEIEECAGQPFIVMELLEGESLLAHLSSQAGKRIPLAQFLYIAAQVCDGLQAAHEKGIVHRDIKPANIFLTKQGITKILDFGVAKLAPEEMTESREDEVPDASSAKSNAIPSQPMHKGLSEELTCPGMAIGTAAYMSPEQIRKERLDSRTDLFSFGLVLYEMATGERAFSGETEGIVQHAILTATPRSARDQNSTLPRSLDAVIKKAIEKDCSRRYRSAAEIRADLERIRTEIRPRRRLRRRVAFSAIFLVLAVGTRLYWGHRSAVGFASNDTIVRSDISNRTSDSVLDDALNLALYLGLQQTPYLNVLGFDKVFLTLQQLGLQIDAKITPEVARQVCLKTNSKMVVASSIADAGNRFQIDLKAIACQSGETVATVREYSRAREDVVHGLGLAIVELRRKLGEPETSMSQFDKPLEEASSSSPDALQLLNQGYRYHLAYDSKNANILYQRAVEVDPNFGLAYFALGTTYHNLGEIGAAKAAITKAYELRSRLTVPARLQVETGYYDVVTGELEKSYPLYVQWLTLFPQDLIARFNFAHCQVALGRIDEAIATATTAVRLTHSGYAYQALMEDYSHLNRFNEAEATFEEAEAHKIDSAILRDDRALLAFMQNDAVALKEQWRWALERKGDAQAVIQRKSNVEAYYGKFREARRTLELARILSGNSNAYNPARVATEQALREAEVGDFKESLRIATSALHVSPNRDEQFKLALAFALAGDLKHAEEMADVLNKNYPLDTLAQKRSLPAVWAAMKLHTNDPTAAIELLRPALTYDFSYNTDLGILDLAYIRGLAYLQIGDGSRAAVEFQKLIDHSGCVGTDVTGALSRLQLARANQISGNYAAARKWYQDFLTLWKDADRDIPIYRQAQAEYSRLPSQ